MKIHSLSIHTKRRKNTSLSPSQKTLKRFIGVALQRITLLVGLLAFCCAEAVLAQSHVAAKLSPMAEWALGAGWGRELTSQPGWGLEHPRLLADVNGDKRQDVVSFDSDGVWLSLATPSGSFSAPTLAIADFGYDQGWRVDKHIRTTADVNGDGCQDIVGFGDYGVWLALSTGNGFAPPQFVLAGFGYVAGNWKVDRHPRMLADINNDGKQDIVGFGDDGVWIARSTGTGFEPMQIALTDFGYDKGWRANKHPRFVVNLNEDGYQDIVGYDQGLVYYALGSASGFSPMRSLPRELLADRFPLYLRTAAQSAPRFVADATSDDRSDLFAFDATAIKLSPSSDLAPPVPANAPGTDRTTSTLAGNIGVEAATLPEIQIAPKPQCSAAKLAEVRARAGALRHDGSFEPKMVFIDCSLTLSSSDVITKRLIFEGARASGVKVEGNGATIDGGSGQPNYKPADAQNMVEFISKRLDSTDVHWEHPENVKLHNCTIIGSVGLLGIQGVESTRDDYVTLARNNAPRNIVFDSVTITGVRCDNKSPQCVPLYLFTGVSYFQLLNSKINGSSDGPNVYLDDLSYHNTFRNNRIEANTQEDRPKREVIAIDGSSYNTIINNTFSSLENGGIYLYRNCGEAGTVRRGTPSNNTIINNFFYYDKYDGDNPAIFVASRNGKSTKTYTCPPNFFDNAQFNVVMQNQIRKRSVSDLIKVGHPEINTPNYINYNETVTAEIERKAGCYISNGYQKDFIRDGEFINLFSNANGEPVITGYRLTCHDGVLSQTSDSAPQVGSVDFECQANGNNNGCQKTVSVPQGKKIIGGKAACNLEFGTVSTTDLNGVTANVVKVLRASDNVSQGSCTLGSTSIRSGQAAVSGINGLNRVSFGCRENDSNGGDCHIKGKLYYQ